MINERIPGIHSKSYEFYSENGDIFLIHNGQNISWDDMTQETFDLIYKAYILLSMSSIRNDIQQRINNRNERLKEFCRIVWGAIDNDPDISEDGEFNFENLEDYHLTPREIEYIKYVCQDMPDKQIADKMSIAYNTATTFRQNIENKTGRRTKVALALWAFKNGIV
jgi:DNA-binding CsgD family transcriptional regulator